MPVRQCRSACGLAVVEGDRMHDPPRNLSRSRSRSTAPGRSCRREACVLPTVQTHDRVVSVRGATGWLGGFSVDPFGSPDSDALVARGESAQRLPTERSSNQLR